MLYKQLFNFKNEHEIFKFFFKNNLINDYRIKIDTGFACNANCFFCYYKKHLNDPFLKKEIVFFQIVQAKKMNFKKMEFSGGESSYHPNWFNFLDFAKSQNLKSSTLSNGFMFSDFDFIKKSKEKGLEEILFSLHSYKENHDKHLGVKGAFDKIIQAIKNAIKLDIITRINITITPSNQKYLNDLFNYLESENILKNIHQINFLPINEWNNAKKIGQKSQDKLNIELLYPIFNNLIAKKKLFNIRYYPYCLINENYHFYIKNHIHHYIDKYDWHPFFIHFKDFKNREKIKAFNKKDIYFYLKKLKNFQQGQYFKTDECKNCKFNHLCDGFKKK